MDLFSDIEKSIQEEKEQAKKPDIFSVSQYLDRVNVALKGHRAKIVGEVTGFKAHQNGHFYFSLLDTKDQSKIECVIWRSNYRMFGVELADGMEIIITSTPNIYKPSGKVSFPVDTIELVGEGALQIAYEKLKAKLSAEGLFDMARKRSIPDFPKTIGVITSKSGAVINDFLSNIGKCGFEIMFVDSKVEGADAIKELCTAVKTLSKKHIDVLVMMRGGGSLESFQAFNNETLVRMITEFPVPVITGIGHDKDAPLVSFASDKNVSTPTAVANLLSSGWAEARLSVALAEEKMLASLESAFRDKFFFLEQSERIMEKSFNTIFDLFDRYFRYMSRAEEKIGHAILHFGQRLERDSKQLVAFGGQLISVTQEKISSIEKILSARSPERQLKLGWSLARKADGSIVRSVQDIEKGEGFDVLVADGTIQAIKK